MLKKTAFALAFAMILTAISPSVGMSRYYHSSGHGHYGHYSYHHHHHDSDEALFWGLTGFFLGTALLYAFLQPPPQQEYRTYVAPQVRIYTYPPRVPPGMCRWERYILDNYGRIMLDQYGQPVMEYTLGSCQYRPN